MGGRPVESCVALNSEHLRAVLLRVREQYDGICMRFNLGLVEYKILIVVVLNFIILYATYSSYNVQYIGSIYM